MANPVSKVADKFIRKFNYGMIGIDDFDMFIIDEGLADNPTTTDPGSLEYRGFVHTRAQARKALDSAGRMLEDMPFRLRVFDRGITYEILPLLEGNRLDSEALRASMRTFSANRQKRAHTNMKSNRALLGEQKSAHERGEISAAELEDALKDYKTTVTMEGELERIHSYILMLVTKSDEIMGLIDKRGDGS